MQDGTGKGDSLGQRLPFLTGLEGAYADQPPKTSDAESFASYLWEITMNRLLVCVVLASVFGIALAHARVATAAGNAFEGRRIFTAFCFVCHGPLGNGKGPLASALKKSPADLTGDEITAKTDHELLLTILSGKVHEQDVGMPRWSHVLVGTEVENVIAYVRYLQKTNIPLIGDPERGSVLYASYCALCHGTEGKGNGVMTQLFTIHPADHTNAKKMDALSNEQLERSISTGIPAHYMPAWRSVLTQSEIDSLVGYIRLLSH